MLFVVRTIRIALLQRVQKGYRYHLTPLIFAVLLLAPALSLADQTIGNSPTITLTPNTTSITEGDSGTKTVSFTISIDECPDQYPINIHYNTSNGNAQSGTDYNAASGDITFATNTCTMSFPVSVTIKGDTVYEPDEYFLLNMSDNGTNSAQSFSLSGAPATITIENDDPEPENENADLQITKSNDKAPNKVNIGDQITYTIVGTNNGPKPTKIKITDTVPSRLSFVSVSDNKGGFNCSYNSSNKKITCTGSHNFTAGETVTVTVKADVISNQSNRIRNYADIISDNSPKQPDPNTGNNHTQSDVYTNIYDARSDKRVRRSNGNWYTSSTAHVGDTLTFRLTAYNKRAHPTELTLTDTLPSGLSLQSATVSGVSGFSCSISGNTVTCTGNHKFKDIDDYPSDKAIVTVTATALSSGRYYNRARVEGESGIRGTNRWSNSVRIDTDLTPGQEYIERSKTVTGPTNPDGNYYVGDTVTFTVRGVTHGLTKKVRILDWLPPSGNYNQNGTTRGAFEYVSHSVGTGAPMDCIWHPNASNTNDNYIRCISQSPLPDGQDFSVQITARLKKAGNVCNRGYFYKEYENSGSTSWGWMGWDETCFDVLTPKEPPVLTPHTFNETVGVPVSIDLKDYTSDPDSNVATDITYTISNGSLPSGITMDSHGVISGTYTGTPTTATISVTATDEVGLSDTEDFTIKFEYPTIQANHNVYNIPAGETISGNLITEETVASWGTTYLPDVGVDLNVTAVNYYSGFPDGNLTWQGDGSFSWTAPVDTGYILYQYTIEDKYGQTSSALLYITTYIPELIATDDSFSTATNTPLYGNVIFDNNGNGVDSGVGISILSHTDPDHGTLILDSNGSFSYAPDTDFKGIDTFVYTVTDRYGQEDNATVTITVGAIVQDGLVDFYLVNPPDTRNIVGNFLTAGNTVLCVTDRNKDHTDPYDGICINDNDINNNERVTRYIDVDGSSTAIGQQTWNSSSSSFTLPPSYDRQGGNGIAWAALFWQGNVNNYYSNGQNLQRRATKDAGSPYGYENITSNANIDPTLTDANKVLIRIDGDSAGYTEITADTLYYLKSYGSSGSTYAAYANITSLLQGKNLAAGTHTVTVANITTNEGQEKYIGDYGGWTLVVIYKEEALTGTPRNISIYNGYQAIGYGGTTFTPNKEFSISGFKLPRSGTVNAKMSAFVGEGEKTYGGSNDIYDKMYIKDNANNYYDMPASDPNNIFDASLDNIFRTSGNNNDVANTNGVDIDEYNVSTIMSDIRDIENNVSNIYIGVTSNSTDPADRNQTDWVTPSMIGFSAELYRPNLCYDYTMSIGGHVLRSENNRIKTTFGRYGGDTPLVTRVSITSKESDFLVKDANITYALEKTDEVQYKPGTTKIAPAGTYAYVDASGQTVDESKSGFTMYIGEGAGSDHGGTIDAFETRFFKFDDNMSEAIIDTSFDLILRFTVNYGSGDLTLVQSFNEDDICVNHPGYTVKWGIFNVADVTASTADANFGRPFNLYTQVVDRKYQTRLFSYNADYLTPNEINSSVEVELFNADFFYRDVNLSCANPDSNITQPVFEVFNQESHILLDDQNFSIANRNTGYRIWYLALHDENRTFVNHHCTSRSDDVCFKQVYDDYFMGDTFCDGVDDMQAENCSLGGSGCYKCLRTYYGTPICSRDNFSLRPEALTVEILDSNTSNALTAPTIKIHDNKTSPSDKNVVAGYGYRYDVNATSHTSDLPTVGYIQRFTTGTPNVAALMEWKPNGHTVSGCNDPVDINLSITLFDGSSIDFNGTALTTTIDSVDQVGRYEFRLYDNNWTSVDWNEISHHNTNNGYFAAGADCISNSDVVPTVQPKTSAVNIGCQISSKHTNFEHPSNPRNYYELPMRFYPYTFKSNLVFKGGPNGTDVVYMNTLDPSNNYPIGYRDIGDKDMSYNIQGIFTAYGYNEGGATGMRLTNFVKDCYADDVNMTLDYIVRTPENVQFRVNLTDKDSSGAHIDMTQKYPWSQTTEPAADIGTATPNAQNIKSTYLAQHGDTFFIKDMNGSIDMDMGINIDRQFQTPMNPVKVTLREFNITDAVNLDLTVNMQTHYQPRVQIPLNDRNITFAYARAKPERVLYDDVTAASIVTPVSVVLYCDLGTVQCLNRLRPNAGGTNYLGNETNEFGWWLSSQHINIGGRTTLLINNGQPGGFALPITNPAVQNIMPDGTGVASNITIFKNPAAALPATVDIEFSSSPATAPARPYTDRWLIYNPDYDPTVIGSSRIPSPFYRVRFIDSSGWTGAGKTGHVVGDDINKKKTRRLEW